MVNRLIHKITTTKDPVIRQICKKHGNVFATDAIISTLMCCTRSVYPWDIVVDVNLLIFLNRIINNFLFLCRN
jgi:translation initiation factor 3 subunit D